MLIFSYYPFRWTIFITLLGYFVDRLEVKHYLLIIIFGVIFFLFIGLFLRFFHLIGLVAENLLHEKNIGTGVGRILLPASILLVFVAFKNSLYHYDINASFWEFSSLLTIVVAITSLYVFSFGRGVFYYRIHEIIYLPNLILSQKNKNNKSVLHWLVFLSYLVTYMYFYPEDNNYVFWN